MDFKDQLKQLADRVEKLRDLTFTEEATKNAFIMPFIQALGYDVFNPQEVIPEFISDIGIKKGEKVDYAIMSGGHPIILIECKYWKDELDVHNTQLLRYFNVTRAKFAILTNGIIYRFYTDLDQSNMMDEKPFLDINILEIKDSQVEELKKFHKSYFNIDNIVNTASFLKYSNEIKNLLTNEFRQPSEQFIRYMIAKVYDGKATTKVIGLFTEITKNSCQQFISDIITERLKTALIKEKESGKQEEEKLIIEQPKENLIETTEEEIEGYYIIKSILRQSIDPSRIFYRDFQRFFSILIDNSIRNTVCRLYLTKNSKQIAFIDENKKEVKSEMTSLDDIYKYSDQLITIAKTFIKD
ncbi:MAG: type I restriction endonuclease [Bacteroidetes bacterium]|nr:type I restriction endonuclease [Bacteroidota bacterium]